MLAEISESRAQGGFRASIRLPIMIQVLSRIQLALSSSGDPDRLVPESLSAVNPNTQLSWGDVAIDSHTAPSMVRFHLKVPKCDQFGSGDYECMWL